MELIKDKWNSKDLLEFYEFEKTLNGDEKDCAWEQKIVNTKLKCFGKTSLKAKMVVKDLKKGNYLNFLDNVKITTHFDSLVCAFLISNIKDFDVFEKYLNKFALTVDNWASCDTLCFKNKDKQKLLELCQKYIKNKKPFVRRIGLNALFVLANDETYINKIFDIIDSLKDEKEYYVNMCASWLVCDCFIKQRNKTLEYFKTNKTNNFIINKSISKCRDSFRVSAQDKQLILQFKKS